ncbi:MAG: hypothetical protein JO072_17155 [Parafilimonas sp.]|nr:hypothetical protein [Parafilimonas sp.]
MNKISYFFFVTCFILFFSCQKELSNETGASLVASGSLWDSSGVCLPDSVHGTFYGGVTPGSDTAYVEIQVNVTQTGSYSITSDQQDGFVFADSGFFSNTGVNIIHLKPIGTPIIPTTSTFNINFDSSFCSFVVNIEDSTGKNIGGNKNAQGSLWDSTGACLPETVVGTFYNGIAPGSDTAYVDVQVNVTQTGNYSITSDLQNGFEFSDTGTFATTGINTIRLKPIGVPILPIATTFSISLGSSLCTFTVNVQDSTGTGLGGGTTTTAGTWQFTQGSATYGGIITDATQDNSSGVATTVSLNGAGITGDTSMTLGFLILGTSIQPGTYTMLNNAITFASGDFLNDFSYTADAFVTGSDLTIIVTSYDAVTKQMQGTFTGSAQDKSGNIVPITNGAFTATVP